MFGIFGGKKKFAANVQDEILKIIDIVRIPEVNDVVKSIRSEMRDNGASEIEIESVKFTLIVAHAVSQPMEHDLDFMYKNFDAKQSAFYCISLYITQIADQDKLSIFEREQPDLYSALKLLWYVCGEAVHQNYEAFGKCVMVPQNGNPFKE